MSENSKIEWTHHTFNPWVGCTKVSPACDHCYAEGWAKRSGMVEWGGERRRTSEGNWNLPLKWERQYQHDMAEWVKLAAGISGRDEAIKRGILPPGRQRVFCASLADVFDNQVPQEWRDDLFKLIGETPRLDWLLLTKRIGNAHKMLDETVDALALGNLNWTDFPWPNVWIGATICNQEEADRDIPKLLQVPAAVRFLSMEPLLGPVELAKYFDLGSLGVWKYGVDWVIVGGESGPNARPMHPAWARSLRDQCAAAGVPFLFKQWGEWAPEPDDCDGTACHYMNHAWPDAALVHRVGKKAAGRLLDGAQHDGYPEATC